MTWPEWVTNHPTDRMQLPNWISFYFAIYIWLLWPRAYLLLWVTAVCLLELRKGKRSRRTNLQAAGNQSSVYWVNFFCKFASKMKLDVRIFPNERIRVGKQSFDYFNKLKRETTAATIVALYEHTESSRACDLFVWMSSSMTSCSCRCCRVRIELCKLARHSRRWYENE